MTVFISYSRRDQGVVNKLATDVERAGMSVWFDRDLAGGDEWWPTILEKIRASTLFVFALSDHSLRSEACTSEIRYAEALGIPTLPVRVGDVSDPTEPVFKRHLVDYRDRTPETAIALTTALHQRENKSIDLPDPLPPEPPSPNEYLSILGEAIRNTKTDMPPSAQASAIEQLAGTVARDDESSANSARRLLERLRMRDDVTAKTVRAIDAVIGGSVEGYWIKVLRDLHNSRDHQIFLIQLLSDGEVIERSFLQHEHSRKPWAGQWSQEMNSSGEDQLTLTFGKHVGTVVRVNADFYRGREMGRVQKDGLDTEESFESHDMAIVRPDQTDLERYFRTH